MEFHWYDLKEPVVAALGLPKPVLHVLFGALAFGCLVWLMRGRRHAPLWAWGGVLLLQFVNEAGDAYDWIGWTGSINYADASLDTVLTMAVPTVGALGWLVSIRREKRRYGRSPCSL
jgi:hypothetical protein